MPGNHSIVAPSAMHLTLACQAHIQLSQGLPPEPPTDASMEGDAADWVAKQYARGNEIAYGTPIPLPGEFKVDYDMIHGAKIWVDVLGYGAVSGTPVSCDPIHPDCWGEPDGWRYDPIEQVIRLPDFKYGFEPHDPFEHAQLVTYMVGIIETLGLDDTQTDVEFIIVQPRAPGGPVKRWRVRADKLRAFVNRLHDAAMRAWPPGGPGNAPVPQATTGTHCVHCPARFVCTALQYQTSRVVQYIAQAGRSAPDPTAVGVEMAILEDAAELLEGRLTALRAQAEAFIRAGKAVPNFELGPGQSRLEWLPGVTESELVFVATALGKSAYKPVPELNSKSSRVVTPTQALKAKIIDAAVIDEYASRPPAGMKLRRITTNTARKAFGDPTV